MIDVPDPEPADDPDYDVFLSHNGDDKKPVIEIAQRLRDAGLRPFLDAWHLVPGEPWQEALEDAINGSRACAVFLGPKGFGPWENEEMRAALSRRVANHEYRVIPVLLPGASFPERGRLPAFLSRLTWVDFRPGLDDADSLDRLVSGIRGLAPEAPEPGDAAAERIPCPFRGLEAFDEEHAEYFVGREALTQHLVEQIREDRFLAVIGPSGSGKSSVVRAGLIPQLRQGSLPGSGRWPINVLRPGPHPMESLASSLVGLVGPGRDALASRDSILSTLTADERGLHTVIQLAVSAGSIDERVVIVVDQFEEVFTLAHDVAERNAFVASLLYASSVVGGATVVVLTIRADFVGKAAGIPTLADRLSERDVLVSPMDTEDLRRAMVLPAERVGLQFEKGLVDTIISDLGDEPGTLPLLQHTLLELFDGRRGRWLTIDRYHDIGGVRGAIAQRAEAVYGRLSESQQRAARRILLRLTQPGQGTEDTRRRAQFSELVPAGSPALDVEAVVNELADARLLITSREVSGAEVVDVAHEALIRGWPRLQGWIDQDAAGLRVQRRVNETANEWAAAGRDPSFLDRGTRLLEASAWAAANPGDLNDLERDFVGASQAAANAEIQTKQRRTRLTIGGLVAATIGFGVLSLLAFRSAQDADAARHLADARLAISEGQRLVAEGQRQAAEDPLLGLRLVVAGTALQRGDPSTADRLKASLLSLAGDGRIASLGADVRRVFGSPDARRLIVGRTASGSLVDPRDGRVLHELTGFIAGADYLGASGQVFDIHPDLEDSTHRLYLLESGTPVTLTAPIAWLEASARPDRVMFVVAYLPETGSVVPPPSELRRGGDGSLVTTLPGPASTAIFSEDAAFVVVIYPSTTNQPPELRRTSDGGLVTQLPELAAAAEMNFGHANNTGNPPVVMFGPPPSKTLSTVAGDPPMDRWTADGRPILMGAGRTTRFDSPDGSVTIVPIADDGRGEIRRVDGSLVALLPDSVELAVFRPRVTDTVVISYTGHAAELRRVADGAVIRDLGARIVAPDYDLTRTVEFSPDPDARYVVLSLGERVEMRRSDTGDAILSTVAGIGPSTPIDFGQGPLPSLILVTAGGEQEVRSFEHPEQVLASGRSLQGDYIFVGPSTTEFIVAHQGTQPSTEILDATSGGVIARLPVGPSLVEYPPDGHIGVVRFSPGINGAPSAPSGIVDLASGSYVELSAGIFRVTFSDDSSLALMSFEDGRTEVWSIAGTPRLLVDLGVGVSETVILQGIDRLAVPYVTGAGYLIDLHLLKALRADPATQSLDELLATICSGPLAELTIPPETLRPYFGDATPPGCTGP